MTYLEKARIDHPDYSVADISNWCPHDFGYCTQPEDCARIDCQVCWNREIKEVSLVADAEPECRIHTVDATPDVRPSKSKYYLDIAAAVATRSTCLRRQYGAIIVKNDVIVSTGYNGAARGESNCCDIGECYRAKMGIPHGEQYEKCVAVHAEANAIINASREEMEGATLYLAGFENGQRIDCPEPCLMCARLIKNAGIGVVVTKG